MDSKFICEFCKKDFATKGNLSSHQKTAKYCLEIQGKNNEDFKCIYCQKKFTSLYNLNEHYNSCKIKTQKITEEKTQTEYESKIKTLEQEYQKEIDILNIKISQKDKEIEKLERKIDIYQEKLFDIASRPTTSNTNKNKETIINNNIRNKKYEHDNKDEDDNDISALPLTVNEKLECALFVNEIIKKKEFEEDYKDDKILQETKLVLNEVTITSRKGDGYINATELCKAGNKKFGHWNSLDTTKDLINTLSADIGITISALVDTNKGGNNKLLQGSWIHPDLAIQLAQWISPSFALQVSRWIRTLFTKGNVVVDDLKLLKQKEQEINDKNTRIKMLENVCLSKQKRIEYPEKNVIYLLTTEDHLKRRTYIIGKAKNLTTRLGTYNKTCDHQVVYYKECKTEEDMTTAETLVLSKLKDYKEEANRDRFILPEDKEISYFISVIDECINFVSY